MPDHIIVGAGFAGTVLAERIASQLNKKVLLLERRSHIGGNCHDQIDSSGVRIHTYGPHLFHTDNKEVFDYLSQFTQWRSYTHHVVASVDKKIIPIPFNFHTLDIVYEKEHAELLKHKLLATYGKNKKVPILELMQEKDDDLKALAQYIYDKIFVNYTAKQWGKRPEEIDGAVTARVPIFTGYDDRYFTDAYQAVPNDGYSQLFKTMLDNPNITLELECDALERLTVQNGHIWFDGKQVEGNVIYTGMIDELFNYRYGELAYRSLDLKFESYDIPYFQEHAVVNYPNEHDYTRITEFKYIHPVESSKTTILKEYPKAYQKGHNTPYYPMFTPSDKEKYQRYANEAKRVTNLILLGRLAEYKYYDMDDIVARALEVFADIISP